jgi:hypothetical protein
LYKKNKEEKKKNKTNRHWGGARGGNQWKELM